MQPAENEEQDIAPGLPRQHGHQRRDAFRRAVGREIWLRGRRRKFIKQGGLRHFAGKWALPRSWGGSSL